MSHCPPPLSTTSPGDREMDAVRKMLLNHARECAECQRIINELKREEASSEAPNEQGAGAILRQRSPRETSSENHGSHQSMSEM